MTNYKVELTIDFGTLGHPSDTSKIVPYLAYLQAVRLLCRVPQEYIGRGAAGKFKYHPPNVDHSFAWGD